MISLRPKIISSSEALFKIDYALSALPKEISENDGKAHAALLRINTKSVPLLGVYWRSAEKIADCTLPKHRTRKRGQCSSGGASFGAGYCGLVVKCNTLPSFSMAGRCHLGWRRDLQVPLPSQAPPSDFSDTSRGTAQNTPVILIMPVTGAACSKFRDEQLTNTIEKWTSPLAGNLQLATSPKDGIFVNSAVAGQEPPWHSRQCCSGLRHLAHLQWSSMEGEAIKQRALQSLGRLTW